MRKVVRTVKPFGKQDWGEDEAGKDTLSLEETIGKNGGLQTEKCFEASGCDRMEERSLDSKARAFPG